MIHPIVTKPYEANAIVAENVDIPSGVSNPIGSESGTEISPKGDQGTAFLPPASSNPLNSYELDKNPQFPGGIKAFLTYVGNNFKTPDVELDGAVKV